MAGDQRVKGFRVGGRGIAISQDINFAVATAQRQGDMQGVFRLWGIPRSLADQLAGILLPVFLLIPEVFPAFGIPGRE